MGLQLHTVCLINLYSTFNFNIRLEFRPCLVVPGDVRHQLQTR
jgi:hypothetical protein